MSSESSPPIQSGTRIDVSDIVGKPGAERIVRAAFELSDAAVALAEVIGPVTADVRLEGILEGLVVVGGVRTDARVRCRGCLEERTESLEIAVSELFSTDPEVEDDEEVYSVDGLEIDVEQMLRDAAVLALPESPLFCEDMESCPNFQAILADARIDSEGDRLDPRWAALSELFPEAETGQAGAENERANIDDGRRT